MRFKGFIFLFSIFISLLNCNFVRAANYELTSQDRVEYQRAIEKVYWQHRIWPKENPGPKPSLEKILPDSAIISKVEDYLRKSNALEQYWQRPITAQQLQAEMDRMVKNTKQPKLLGELFTALNNDPHIIAECLARPALVDRLIHNWYANDDRFHGELRQRVENELRGISVQSMHGLSGKYSEMERLKANDSKKTNDPTRVALSVDEWKEWTQELQAMFGKQIQTDKVSPIIEEMDRFYVTAVLEKANDKIKIATVEWPKTTFDSWWSNEKKRIPTDIVEDRFVFRVNVLNSIQCVFDTWTPTQAPFPEARSNAKAVWTGTEMIIWGGSAYSDVADGGLYNPSTDSWRTVSTVNAPYTDNRQSVVWTGSEMIVWGLVSSGGRYNPTTDIWTTMTSNAPPVRHSHSAIWTGMEMIIWGGTYHDDIYNEDIYYNDGARYDPVSDIWTPITLVNAPEPRFWHKAVWTGSEMIVWGGVPQLYEDDNALSTGGRYDPSTDSWTPTSIINVPQGRWGNAAIWTGTEMIIWGGSSGYYGGYLINGARYNPSTDNWTPTSNNNSPPANTSTNTIWTGTEMILWGGGIATLYYLNSGWRYNPTTDSWTSTSLVDAPEGRIGNSAIWTGNEMIVWGGWGVTGLLSTGARYNPSTDSWIPTINTNVPAARIWNTAVWTGNEMIIWGGGGYNDDWDKQNLNSGGRYDPATDSWIPTTFENVPEGRFNHTAIWTGNEMIIWGGRTGDAKLFSTGGKYNPSTDSWIATSNTNAPQERTGHTAVWSGSEMIVWGGYSQSTGGRYNPLTDSWIATSTMNAPEARGGHTAIWTDNEMIIWGGSASNSLLTTGGRYNALTDSWTPTSTTDVPEARSFHTAIWTGNEMIVWGGFDYVGNHLFNGSRYNPLTDGWTPTSNINVPEGRSSHSAVWTGNEMIVWGGSSLISKLSSGGRYNPLTDSWIPTSSVNVPEARFLHTAVWTGTQMIVWGGDSGVHGSLQTGGLYCAKANNAPVATDDWYSIDKNFELNIPPPWGVIYNDSDEDGDVLTAVLDTNPTYGTLNFNPDGSFIYHPNWGFSGNDTFTYHVTDGLFDSNIATVQINVFNTPPFANDDSYVTIQNEILNVAAPGVLSNDSDYNGDTMYALLYLPPSNGYLSLNFDGSFSYEPYEGFVGQDWFAYFVDDDGTVDSNLATVTITVTNVVPIAVDDTYQTNKNVALNIAAPGILGNDSDPNSDPLNAVLDVAPTHGTLSLNYDGSFAYTPNADYAGADSFTYHANDGVNDSNPATVNLRVNDCLYCDQFNDGNLDPNWTYIKQSWNESNGALIGTPTARTAIAIATPIFAGCQTCSIEASMRSGGGAFNKVWMLGWYVDKKNTMELLMKEENDRWILKQRVNGSVVAKARGIKTIDPNTDYAVRITFDGISFKVFVDDFVTPLFTLTPPASVPVGTVGFKVKNTTGSFDYVSIN